jgi:1,4-dihydroxy-2-naphthoate polyprenyltransferase
LTIKNFLKYVEIQTKVASVLPLLFGTLFSIYRYKSFHYINFIIMFISLISFDMATTAINNYVDYKKSHSLKDKDSAEYNPIVKEGISEIKAVSIIFILLTIAIISGLILVFRTSIMVLIIGVLAFAVGIFYTFGPIPLSRMPLGEIFSGFFMGFVIMFLSIYIQTYDLNIIKLLYSNGILSININILECIYVFMISIPAIGGIANIMLANNICDVEEDIVNKRFTLPYYLGRRNSLRLFNILYYIGYLDIILLVAIGVAPTALLLALFTFIPVYKGIRTFNKTQVKGETFVISVKNLVLMNGSLITVLAAVLLIRQLIK